MDYRRLLVNGDRRLDPGDHAEWEACATPLGLTPYTCKASYVIGVLREMLASAGLCLSRNYHLSALFLALDATELVGRCHGGYRERSGQAGSRLKEGLRYLETIDPEPTARAHTVDEYANLRNFLGHGAASSQANIEFESWSSIRLLQLLALALNVFWRDDDDQRVNNFAKAEVKPLLTIINGRREAIYVHDIQALLANGTQPGEDVPFDNWRNIQSISAGSPDVTGSAQPSGGSSD